MSGKLFFDAFLPEEDGGSGRSKGVNVVKAKKGKGMELIGPKVYHVVVSIENGDSAWRILGAREIFFVHENGTRSLYLRFDVVGDKYDVVGEISEDNEIGENPVIGLAFA